MQIWTTTALTISDWAPRQSSSRALTHTSSEDRGAKVRTLQIYAIPQMSWSAEDLSASIFWSHNRGPINREDRRTTRCQTAMTQQSNPDEVYRRDR